MDRVGGQLKQPVHVDPGPPARADRERIRPQPGVPPHHLAPGGEVPEDVAVGDRRQRDQERAGGQRGGGGERGGAADQDLSVIARSYFVQGNQPIIFMSSITRPPQTW